jgi:dolichol-phosphate mannosyltransferase
LINGNAEQTESNKSESRPGRALIVLCTYNEIANLPQAVAILQHVAPECDVLVVDDNSPDGTGKWAAAQASVSERLHVLGRSGKLGLGSALRDAIRWCLERDYEFMINLDADLSHDPAKVPEFLKIARTENVDVVIGSRYIAGGGTEGLSIVRKILSRSLNRYATRVLQLPVRDCSGSYRCYRVSKLRELQLDQLTCNGYGFLEEILVTLHRLGAIVREIPITYHERHGGQSKLSWSDATGTMGVIWKLRRR